MQSALAKQPPVQEPAQLVQTITQEDFPKFISAPYALIRAGDKVKKMPPIISARYGLFHSPPVRLGVMDLSVVDWTPGIRLYVGLQLKVAGLNPDIQGRPPAGYYLFSRGALLGFHPGNIDIEQDQKQLGIALFAKLLGHNTNDSSLAELGKEASFTAATWNAGERVIEVFDQLIKNSTAR
ncbi:hypothetical protein BO221_00565 [Archangium sp. Cb G35]|uniref:hypothetical protein n=1 Tax=Archangium sp. Cb G35 TaxID=1920190 RepID=UPI000937FD1E|nr:hypothetical protein [Archangium sp. Cb G35]OJT26572.1 hypothetical protein BO221_00565 [Archangium sp. Cb G35]